MYKVVDLSQVGDCIDGKFELFICFNSFETRCTSIAKHIPKEQFASFLILTNEQHLENAKKNLHELTNLLGEKSSTLALDLSMPVAVADRIIDRLDSINAQTPLRRVFIDITTFTHETLLILLAIVNEKYKKVEIVCGYNNAKEYSTDRENPKMKWLSRGIGDVRSILGYSGEMKPSRDNLLMIIVGYEYERAAKIIDVISPDFLSIGYNIETNATTEKDRNANIGFAKLLKNMAAYFDNTMDFVVPSDDPYSAYCAICKKLDEIGNDVNVTIVPMNNKLSTIGVALVGISRPEVQICYAPALVYNTSAYSKPGDTCYVFSFEIPT